MYGFAYPSNSLQSCSCLIQIKKSSLLEMSRRSSSITCFSDDFEPAKMKIRCGSPISSLTNFPLSQR